MSQEFSIVSKVLIQQGPKHRGYKNDLLSLKLFMLLVRTVKLDNNLDMLLWGASHPIASATIVSVLRFKSV